MVGFSVWSFQRERERERVWDFSGLKDIFQVFDQFVILSRSEEREEAAATSVRRIRNVTTESEIKR